MDRCTPPLTTPPLADLARADPPRVDPPLARCGRGLRPRPRGGACVGEGACARCWRRCGCVGGVGGV